VVGVSTYLLTAMRLFPYYKYPARKVMRHFAFCGLMPKTENKSK